MLYALSWLSSHLLDTRLAHSHHTRFCASAVHVQHVGMSLQCRQSFKHAAAQAHNRLVQTRGDSMWRDLPEVPSTRQSYHTEQPPAPSVKTQLGYVAQLCMPKYPTSFFFLFLRLCWKLDVAECERLRTAQGLRNPIVDQCISICQDLARSIWQAATSDD
jgi:hypothetical protein